MTSKTPNDENRPLADHDLDLIHGGFFLMELLVVVKEVAIIIGMPAPKSSERLVRDDFGSNRFARIRFTSPRRGEVDLRSKSGEGALL